MKIYRWELGWFTFGLSMFTRKPYISFGIVTNKYLVAIANRVFHLIPKLPYRPSGLKLLAWILIHFHEKEDYQ